MRLLKTLVARLNLSNDIYIRLVILCSCFKSLVRKSMLLTGFLYRNLMANCPFRYLKSRTKKCLLARAEHIVQGMQNVLLCCS